MVHRYEGNSEYEELARVYYEGLKPIRFGKRSSHDLVVGSMKTGGARTVNIVLFHDLRLLLSHIESHDELMHAEGFLRDEIMQYGTTHVFEFNGRKKLAIGFRSDFGIEVRSSSGAIDEFLEITNLAQIFAVKRRVREYLLPHLPGVN